ncbi:hypothetical protein S7711_05769 [Stachybotrys chartarum IBT 7711]|uniref:ATP-grasp domain-containing protein n=1 Tax=Stachybotrys chartarum (strain CBS 109288 / IBT 7711) TaxID=1280523 RepID=A0A084ATF6_STACB|nr:hypothetical protein S7711_05769 [Stachybotrys chartarum IBT 7711]
MGRKDPYASPFGLNTNGLHPTSPYSPATSSRSYLLPSEYSSGIMANSSAWHLFKNAALILLSLALLPLNTAFVLTVHLYNRHVRAPQPIQLLDSRKNVLVTGVSMAKGLALARQFHRRGHRVVGADFHPLSLGAVSVAVHSFHRLPRPTSSHGEDDPYVRGVLDVVRREGVDLWITASDVNAAMHDAVAKMLVERETKAKVIQFGPRDIEMLHEKDAFMEHCKELDLPVPETKILENKDGITEFLEERGGLQLQPGGKQYLVKPIGVDDSARLDMPLLPLSSASATAARITSIPFKTTSLRRHHYIIQEYISGPEYCTHALVVRGRVRAFLACPSSELLMHYRALPPDAPLTRAMLDFTQRQAAAGGERFTGHMSFDFLVKSEDAESKRDARIYSIECNPRVHTAVLLFNDTPELVDELLSVFQPQASLQDAPLTPAHPQRYYWVGQDLVELVLYPLYCALVAGTTTRSQLSDSVRVFVEHVMYWKDGTFETWDPWPWWWLYHVYWPVQFARFMVKGRWQKLNVSTGKAFGA